MAKDIDPADAPSWSKEELAYNRNYLEQRDEWGMLKEIDEALAKKSSKKKSE